MSGTKPPRLLLSELMLSAAIGGKVLLIVEGPRDRDFYEWFLYDKIDRVHIYTADDVEVEPAQIHKIGLTMGARSQLIFLSTLSPDDQALRLLIDRDCGNDIPKIVPATLMLTDYPAVESYAFTKRALNKWLKIIAPEAGVSVSELIADVRLPLFQLYHMRKRLPGMRDPKHDKYYSRASDGKWSLNLKKLALDFGLNETDVANIEGLSRKSVGDPRQYVYGHDLAALLDLRLKAVLRNRAYLRMPEAVERTLRLSMEHVDLAAENLFHSLRSWIQTSSPSL